MRPANARARNDALHRAALAGCIARLRCSGFSVLGAGHPVLACRRCVLGGVRMSGQTLVGPAPATGTTATSAAHAAVRPAAARTKLLLEDPILPTLLRLSAPNVLNLLAITRSTACFS